MMTNATQKGRRDLPASDRPTRPPAATMRAVVQKAYGTSAALHLDQVETPEISKDEVLVRVHAAGLDRGTWHLMTGRPYLLRVAFGLRAPRNPIPGRDVAGTVVAVGSAVTQFTEGDEVFGVAPGSFAEYAVARESKLAHKPPTVSFEQAAVVPISGVTSIQALTDAGRIQPGQKVLVIGASGGVGSYAVQLAKAFGAEVTGVCSTAKLDLVRSLGADHVIDYTCDDFADTGERYDLILDIAGGSHLSRLRRALTFSGTAVLVGNEQGDSLTGGMGRQLRARVVSLFVRQRLTSLLSKERGSDVRRLAELLASGQLTPSIDQTFPLERAPEAMSLLEGGRVRGKVAISVTGASADQEG